MSFILKCDNCGNEVQLKNERDYTDPFVNKTRSLSLTFGPVADDGVDIACKECGEEITINKN